MSTVSHRILRHGVLNFPRPTPASKVITENLLLKDAQSHHCYFRSAGLHNHLSHHLLAAYDLGASSGLLQKIYDDEASIQRPIMLEDQDKKIHVTTDNWVQHVGNPNAYGGFFAFFQDRISSAGVLSTLEEYIFSSSANDQGVNMLVRLMSGALHPFIQIGYGLEFGNDTLISTGLAQTAIHTPLPSIIFQEEKPSGQETNGKPANRPNDTKRNPSSGLSVLEIMKQVYDSSILHPVMPYDPDALVNARIKAVLCDGRPEEIRRLCSQFHVDETMSTQEMNDKVEECIWTSTLLLFATGREGRKPRLDFFLMHLVTSSIFLRSYVDVLKNPAHKARVIKVFLPSIILLVLSRGRPIIRPELVMQTTDKPRPPLTPDDLYKPDKTSVGSPLEDDEYDPWPALIACSTYAPDSHVLKTMRTLIFAAREYGDTPAGGVIGAFARGGPVVPGTGEQIDTETLVGCTRLDGSVFVRAAGMLMDYMGWTIYGQSARSDWDRSALGWDDAWGNEIDIEGCDV